LGSCRQPVGPVEVGSNPVLEDALEVEVVLREPNSDRLDLAPLFAIGPQPGGVKWIIEVLRRQQYLATAQDVVDVFDHRHGEAWVFRRAFAEPCQRAPAFAWRQVFALEAGAEHVREPAAL